MERGKKEHFTEEKGRAVRGVCRQGPAHPHKWICVTHTKFRGAVFHVFLCLYVCGVFNLGLLLYFGVFIWSCGYV